MRLSVKAGQGTRIVDARGSKEKDSQWVYEFQDVKPMESRSVVVITQLDSNCLESLITAELAMEPEGKKAKIATTDKRQPILQKNKLTIFHELIGSGQSLYQEEESNFKIFLYGKDGEELRGTYPYRGSRSGYLRSGDQLPLRGNQYITIDPGKFHPDIGYRVVRLEDGKNVTFWNTEGQTGRGACADSGRRGTAGGQIFQWQDRLTTKIGCAVVTAVHPTLVCIRQMGDFPGESSIRTEMLCRIRALNERMRNWNRRKQV